MFFVEFQCNYNLNNKCKPFTRKQLIFLTSKCVKSPLKTFLCELRCTQTETINNPSTIFFTTSINFNYRSHVIAKIKS